MCIQAENQKSVPVGFDVQLSLDLGQRFAGPVNFVEDLEKGLPYFYDEVTRYLRAWQPAAPQPVRARVAQDTGVTPEPNLDGEAPEPDVPVRHEPEEAPMTQAQDF